MNKTILLPAAIIIAITISVQSTQANPNLPSNVIEQERVCHIDQSQSAGKLCNDGDIMLYIPINPIGSSREMVILTSLVCDFRFNISQSPEALTCVFTSKRNHQWSEFGMDSKI